MKIILIHGDDIYQIDKRLQFFLEIAKKRNLEIYRVYDSNLNLTELLASDTLFASKKFVLVENYKLIDSNTLRWLNKKKDFLDLVLVIYHKDFIPETFIKKLPKIDKLEEYKLPKFIWSFLESFYPKNSTNSLKLLHKTLKKEPIELVFFLLAKQVRDLFWIKTDPKSLTYPSWKKERLRKQASRFDSKSLANLLSELSEIDIKSKTSQLELVDLLDFMILTKLE